VSEPRPIDVLHLGREHVICCWQAGDVIVDPGPESCIETLIDGLGGEPPRAVLLTHIHFDHAGAAGALVRRWPEIEVWVHELGAPHVIDPARLVASARQLYGEEFDRLWGEVVPIPEKNLRVLSGGEEIGPWRVEYTPGHAKHHVCYLDTRTGAAYTGDVAGVHIAQGAVIAPTPPPDIDVEAWHDSIRIVEGWQPTSLHLTHFGRVEDVAGHLAAMHSRLDEQARLARELSQEEFCAALERVIAADTDDATAAAYVQASPPHQLYVGLERYWRKRAEREAAELSA
jgi:glyoxylase-like metal-dependent hydrolase (beta-lactamase superfamily II)